MTSAQRRQYLTRDEVEEYEERAGILEFDAGLSRDDAEERAFVMAMARREKRREMR